MTRYFPLLSVLVVLVLMVSFGCITFSPSSHDTANMTPPQELPTQQCPVCDDNNPCTYDRCSAATNYTCVYEPLSGKFADCKTTEPCKDARCEKGTCVVSERALCCGNKQCETGETYATCPSDCPPQCPESCDDKNPCTQDVCGAETNYTCRAIPLTGRIAGCNESKGPCYGSQCREGMCVIDVYQNCCGNRVCEKEENCTSCPRDCPYCFEALSVKQVTMASRNTFNCMPLKMTVEIENSAPYSIVVSSPNAISVRDETESASCNVPPKRQSRCVVTIPVSFGTIGKNTGLITVLLEGKKAETSIGEIITIFQRNVTVEVTNEIEVYSSYCEHTWCKPNHIWTSPGNNPRNYTIVGMENYREKRMCYGYAETEQNRYQAYFSAYNQYVCIKTIPKNDPYNPKEECNFT